MAQEHAIRPRRSVLYMPGANARALEKAKSVRATRIVKTERNEHDVAFFTLKSMCSVDAKLTMLDEFAEEFGR